MKTIAIIQARTAASRLPGKIFMDINGKPMLSRVIERVRRAKMVDEIVIATTKDHSDDNVEQYCLENACLIFRGNAFDVLDRYYQAARHFQADLIVRITADCPLIDPSVIDHTVNSFLNFGIAEPGTISPESLRYDFAANRLPPPWKRTYPIGLDTEVTTFQNLEVAWKEAAHPHQREHVMPFFYEQPERYRILHVTHKPDFGDFRWTVDTPSDLEVVDRIYRHFEPRQFFNWLEIIALYDQHPELKSINALIEAKDYRETDSRLNLDRLNG